MALLCVNNGIIFFDVLSSFKHTMSFFVLHSSTGGWNFFVVSFSVCTVPLWGYSQSKHVTIIMDLDASSLSSHYSLSTDMVDAESLRGVL
jgi:hypothetical protein